MAGAVTGARLHKTVGYRGASATAGYGPGNSTFYIDGNYVAGSATVTANNWNGGVDLDGGVTQAQARATTPFAHLPITQQTAEAAYDYVLNYAGASLHRDAVAARVVSEVRSGTTTFAGSKTGKPGIIGSQTDVGGWPVLAQAPAPTDTDKDGMPDDWETARGLNPGFANATRRDRSTAYDNVGVPQQPGRNHYGSPVEVRNRLLGN